MASEVFLLVWTFWLCFAIIPSACNRFDLEEDEDEQSGQMLRFFLSVFRLVRFVMSGDAAIAIENAALRLQLAAFQRQRKRPVLTSFDRLFWVGLSLVWNGWRAALVYVQPDTVVRWQRERFRKFWARLSRMVRKLDLLAFALVLPRAGVMLAIMS